MGSGSSKPRNKLSQPHQLSQDLAPKPTFKRYPGYRTYNESRARCVKLGNPLIADRHPDKLALLMLYDTRYAWRDIELTDYRNKLRNVFAGDGEVLQWLHSEACRYRLSRGRALIDRNRDPIIPFIGDPMYGVYVDWKKVIANLDNLWRQRRGRITFMPDLSYLPPTNPDAPIYRHAPQTGAVKAKDEGRRR